MVCCREALPRHQDRVPVLDPGRGHPVPRRRRPEIQCETRGRAPPVPPFSTSFWFLLFRVKALETTRSLQKCCLRPSKNWIFRVGTTLKHLCR